MLLQLLRRQALAHPDAIAVVETNGAAWTYADLNERADAAARRIAEAGTQRFAARTESVPALIALLAGASWTGAEGCVYARDLDEDGVAQLADRFDHHIVVEGAEVQALTETDGGGELPPEAPRSPLLILTTGTTGIPKGARHDWRRLLAAARERSPEPGSRWLLAYNLHQFAGVQMLVHVLSIAGTLVVPASPRPPDALEAIRRHGVTHASATATFWRFLLAELGASDDRDLPLRQITLGGEAVDSHVLAALRGAFPAARISQIYAATEFGSAVSVRDGRSGLPASILDRGDESDVRFKVVDGELWTSSRVGMLGYHGEEVQDEVDLEDPLAWSPWRATGDLVEVRDGRVEFMGRTSDTINVGGVKVHPLPIEETVRAVSGVRLARVYGRANPMTGHIVAVDVVVEDGADTGAIDGAIRDACESLPPAARPRRIRFVSEDDVEVRGGKLVRGVQE